MNFVLNNNFDVWLRTYVFGITSNWSPTSTGAAGGKCKTIGDLYNTQGELIPEITLNNYYDYPSMTTQGLCSYTSTENNTSLYTYFKPGNGRKNAEKEDISLSGDYAINVDYSASWRAVENPFVNNDNQGEITFLVTFTAINEIDISEVGLFKRVCTSSSNSSSLGASYYKEILFGRNVLENNCHLNPGETVSFQLTITL